MSDDLTFVQVGDLAKGITQNRLPEVGDLAGKTFELVSEDGAVERLRFGGGTLIWEPAGGVDAGPTVSADYRATSPREGVYFVDFVRPDARATTISVVLDLPGAEATVVTGTLPTEAACRKDMFSRACEGAELTDVSVRFRSAGVGAPVAKGAPRHRPTTELVGKRVRYVYSDTETYEHVYLNERLYTWHCLEGIEKGLADTDRCHTYRIDEGLYLFVWREKIVPTLGIVMIDLQRMKTTGKIFGYEGGDFGTLVNAPVGAYATLLNVTTHG